MADLSFRNCATGIAWDHLWSNYYLHSGRGSYLTPDLLGGTESQMIANVIERRSIRQRWPGAHSLSC